MSGRRWSFTDGALAVSIVLAVGLGGLLLHLNSRAVGAQRTYAQSIRDFKDMLKLRERYRDLERQKNRMPTGTPMKADSAPEFLSQKAGEAGLTNPKIVTETPVQSPGWRELPWTLAVDGGSAGTVSRRSFIRFLDLVESQSPSFKSRSISLRFAGDKAPEDLKQAAVTFSHFERR